MKHQAHIQSKQVPVEVQNMPSFVKDRGSGKYLYQGGS